MVVNVFGQFVGGGNLVIGAIVFIVLIIIQFVVINKGSERVAEVTARFTLDAMPGKQMAQFSLALEECTQQFNIVCKVINCTQSLDYADRYFARSKFIFDRMTEREKIVRFVFEEERRIRRREME